MTTLTVGSGEQFATITAAVASAHTGDTILVNAGTYVNDFPALINGLTIQGVGGIANLVATAQPGNGKAIFDVAGNTTLQNLSFSGTTVGDGNGAGVRYESGNLNIQNCVFTNNQNGILGAADPNGSITINQSEFSNNGAGDGKTHNLYIGAIANFTLTNSYVHDAQGGNEVKSRAANNVIQNNRIFDNGNGGGYSIDLSNAGNATITGNVIEKGANVGQHVMIAYGEEGATNPGTSVTVSNNSFVNDSPAGTALWDTNGTRFTTAGNTTFGVSVIDRNGTVTTGFSALSARPSLNTASPVSITVTTPPVTVPPVTVPPVTTPPVTTPPAATDTTPPTVTASEALSGWTKSTSDTLTGTAHDPSGVARVEIYDTVGATRTDLGAATLGNGNAWSFTAANLANGPHQFSAVATDKAGNSSAAISAGATVNVDTVAPVLTATESASGSTSATSDRLSGTVSDAGSGVARVELFDGSADLGSATLGANGTWSFTASNLAAGAHAFTAVATDQVGNASAPVSAGAALTVQPAAPTWPTPPTPPAPPSPPAPPAAPVATTVDSMTLTGNGPLTISGHAAPGDTISITDTILGHALRLGTATAGSDGLWSLGNLPHNLATLPNQITASATSPSGVTTSGAGALYTMTSVYDTAQGHPGAADVFAVAMGDGHDTITGFETTNAVGAAHDVIDLQGTGFTSFAQVQSSLSGGSSATLTLDWGDSITLPGVSAASLRASDFRFG